MKTCSKCKAEKTFECFGIDKQKKDGLRSYCKDCRKLYYQLHSDELILKSANYRLKNPEKGTTQRANYYKNNKEKIAIYNREWRKCNKEWLADYYLKNKEKRSAYFSLHRKNNPEIYRLQDHKRRALERKDNGVISKGLAEKLLKLQKGKCPCCKLPLGSNYHIDHIIPLSRGGSNTDDNIQLLRAKCNLQKSSRDPVEFMQSRGFLF